MSYLQSFKSHVIAIVFLLAWLVSTSPASAQGVREQIDELNSNWVVAFKCPSKNKLYRLNHL